MIPLAGGREGNSDVRWTETEDSDCEGNNQETANSTSGRSNKRARHRIRASRPTGTGQRRRGLHRYHHRPSFIHYPERRPHRRRRGRKGHRDGLARRAPRKRQQRLRLLFPPPATNAESESSRKRGKRCSRECHEHDINDRHGKRTPGGAIWWEWYGRGGREEGTSAVVSQIGIPECPRVETRGYGVLKRDGVWCRSASLRIHYGVHDSDVFSRGS